VLWPPSSQISLPCGARSTSAPDVSRCILAGHSAPTMPRSKAAGVDPQTIQRAQRRNRKAGIVELMPAEQPRCRQVHQAAFRPDRPAARARQ